MRGVVFDNANSVDEYYRDASYGQLALTGDVFGWYTIDATNAGCAYTTWANQARAKATAAGVQLSRLPVHGVRVPAVVELRLGGARLPAGNRELDQRRDDPARRRATSSATTSASTTRARSRATGGTRDVRRHAARQSEYGDPFTVMGSAQTRHHVNWHRAQFSWFTDTQTVTTTGTHLLAPAELTGTPRMLRVARGDGTYLNLEFRQPWGIFDNFGAGDPVVNGVSIRIAPALTSLVQSKLVDANPSTSTFSDAALGSGSTSPTR